MKKTIIPLLAACFLWACSGNADTENKDPHAGHNHGTEAADSHAGHNHSGHDGHNHGAEAKEEKAGFGGEIVLEPEVAKRFGVRVAKVEAGEFASAVRASGIVLQSAGADGIVSAPVAGIVHFSRGIELGSNVGKGAVIATIDTRSTSGGDANAAARAALNAAKREFDRIEALYKEQLATVAELNAARAALEQARAAYSPSASNGQAHAPIAGVITTLDVREGQYVDAGTPIASVGSANGLTVRIDLPRRYYNIAPTLTDATLELPYGGGVVRVSELGGKRLSTTPVGAPGVASAFVPVYFTLPGASGMAPGATFSAYLLGAKRDGVVSVPRSALIEAQGDYFVFEQLDAEGYRKVPVRIGQSNGQQVEIVGGLTSGTPIVVEGATTVRLAEASAAIPEGHSHNH